MTMIFMRHNMLLVLSLKSEDTEKGVTVDLIP
jgi:hypothetical protein